jgi:tetratricopeptide (TPR) repeat protein
MPSLTDQLQHRAVEFAKSFNFGPDALATNLELTRVAPSNEGAWTRLARCYLESGQLDEATAALDAALAINPQSTIARNLHLEVTKRRAGAMAVVDAPRARASRARRTTESGRAAPSGAGFGRAEFAALGQLQPASVLEALGARLDALLAALNDRPFASKAVETRNRAGRSGVRLFRRGSFHAGYQGHIYAFHFGGRWEPQLNIGLYAAQPWGPNCIRAGIGFNLTQGGADPDRESGQERALAFFEHFQRLVSAEWRQLLTQWMGTNGGFIQYGDRGPARDMLPAAAVEWLVNCHNPAEVGWIFCGRWLFADNEGDADLLAEGKKLTAWIERSFADVLPLWATLYRQP